MEESFKEFSNKIKKASNKRVHKIKKSVYTIDGFYYYRKTKPDFKEFVLKDVEYLSIIREMNLLLLEELFENKFFNLPCGMGKIIIVKKKTRSWFDKNDKFSSNKKIDMHSTVRLWYEDEEARINKTLVRFDNEYLFKLKYVKTKPNYKNSTYYTINFCRSLKKKLSEIILNSDFDAYEIEDKKHKYINEQIKMNKS